MRVDITGIDRVALLYYMWRHAETVEIFTMDEDMHRREPRFDYEMARLAVTKAVAHFCGRAIMCDFGAGHVLNVATYEMLHGKGCVASFVEQLRTRVRTRTPYALARVRAKT